jgi:hypothetical protein
MRNEIEEAVTRPSGSHNRRSNLIINNARKKRESGEAKAQVNNHIIVGKIVENATRGADAGSLMVHAGRKEKG